MTGRFRVFPDRGRGSKAFKKDTYQETEMARKLGVFVSSDKHLDKVIQLCNAAKVKGDLEVTIFFTHMGTLLTQDPRFGELQGLAKMSLCNVGFESHHLKPPVVGIGEKDFATQARHGEMIEECDRYVAF
jgi:hypothetical protein